MKIKSDESKEDTLKCDIALRKIANFCSTYNSHDLDDLNSRLLTTIIGQNHSLQSIRYKDMLLDYVEAMEEVLPALTHLNNHIRSLSPSIANGSSYNHQIAYRKVFSSLKPVD